MQGASRLAPSGQLRPRRQALEDRSEVSAAQLRLEMSTENTELPRTSVGDFLKLVGEPPLGCSLAASAPQGIQALQTDAPPASFLQEASWSGPRPSCPRRAASRARCRQRPSQQCRQPLHPKGWHRMGGAALGCHCQLASPTMTRAPGRQLGLELRRPARRPPMSQTRQLWSPAPPALCASGGRSRMGQQTPSVQLQQQRSRVPAHSCRPCRP